MALFVFRMRGDAINFSSWMAGLSARITVWKDDDAKTEDRVRERGFVLGLEHPARVSSHRNPCINQTDLHTSLTHPPSTLMHMP